jgi:hypothetical protein
MSDEEWRRFFCICARVLGAGARDSARSLSWCSWPTFDRLISDSGYWTGGILAESNLLETSTDDGGPWGQPFSYRSIAHIVIPREFYWETIAPGHYENGSRPQDIHKLSKELTAARLAHRLTDLVLEVKLY